MMNLYLGKDRNKQIDSSEQQKLNSDEAKEFLDALERTSTVTPYQQNIVRGRAMRIDKAKFINALSLENRASIQEGYNTPNWQIYRAILEAKTPGKKPNYCEELWNRDKRE